MTIRCKYNGEVFIPEDPVNLAVGQEVELTVHVPSKVYRASGRGAVIVDPPDGAPATVKDLLESGIVGLWADREDVGDSTEFVRRSRSTADWR